MRSVILVLWILVFCGLGSSLEQDLQPGDIPINVGSLRFIRRPLAQRFVNTVTSTYFYPSPRLEYINPFNLNPLETSRYQSLFLPYNPSLYSPLLGSQVYTHYPYLSGGQINPLFITTN